MDSDKKAEVQERNRQFWINEERKISGINGFETFAYSDCQSLQDNETRAKRHALMLASNKLSLEQEEALEGYFRAKRSIIKEYKTY